MPESNKSFHNPEIRDLGEVKLDEPSGEASKARSQEAEKGLKKSLKESSLPELIEQMRADPGSVSTESRRIFERPGVIRL